LKTIKRRLFFALRPFFKILGQILDVYPLLRNLAFRFYAWIFFRENSVTPHPKSSKFKVPAEREIDGAHLSRPVIVFDCQALRGPSFSRGIGRYSLSLIINFARQYSDISVVLFFNNFENKHDLGKILALIPSNIHNIKIFMSEFQSSNGKSDLEASDFMSSEILQLNPRLVLLLSVFEHPHNVIPLTLNIFRHSAAILYDVIPIQFPDLFLKSTIERTIYEAHLRQLLSAEILLSISHSSKQNLQLRFPSRDNIGVISGSGYFQHEANVGVALNRRRGIICVASDSRHKNVRNLIYAYALLSKELKINHPLNIVGVHSERERKNLRLLATSFQTHVTFHSFLSDMELSDLYKSCRLAIAPAWEEGFGMPVVEAWQDGCVVLGSYGTAISEILGTDVVTFDPHSVDQIFELIQLYLEDDNLWLTEQARLSDQRASFSWEETARLMYENISYCLAEETTITCDDN